MNTLVVLLGILAPYLAIVLVPILFLLLIDLFRGSANKTSFRASAERTSRKKVLRVMLYILFALGATSLLLFIFY